MKDRISPKLRLFILHLLRRVGDDAEKVAKKHMEATCGLTPREWGVLHLIHDHPQNQQEIANSLSIDRAAMVHIADRLEKQGCLKRTANPDDRRQHLLKITPKGLAAYRAGTKAVTTMQDELLAELTHDERKTLQDFLLRILER